MNEKNKQRFARYGFRRNTHTKEGIFNAEESNEWQAHIWNRTQAIQMGKIIPSKVAVSFEDIVKLYGNSFPNGEMDREDISFLLIQLIECKLITIEQIEDYETDIYEVENPFWKIKH